MEKKSKFRRLLTRIGSLRLSQICNKLKKPVNFCWKAGAALAGIVLAIAIVIAGIDWIKDTCGLTYYYWCDEDLGKNIEIRHFSNSRAAAYNKVTDERMSPKVRWISGVPERDSLTVFCDLDGKRGYLDVNTGKVVIDGQYTHAWHFSEGLAAVVAENGKVGFINRRNEMVIPPVYDHITDFDYLFKDGVCVVRDARTRKYGAIDTLGTVRLPLEYSRIFKAHNESTWYLRKDGKCGLADADMNVIFEPVYDNISVQDKDCQAYLTSNGVKQLVSFEGEVIIPFVIDEAWPLEYPADGDDEDGNTNRLHPYLVGVMVDYYCNGVMDSRTGKMIIPAIYTDVDMISKELIKAELGGEEENNVLFTVDGVMLK